MLRHRESGVEGVARGVLLTVLLGGAIPNLLLAQTLPPIIDPTGRSGEPQLPSKEQPLRPERPPSEVLPPVQSIPRQDQAERGPVLRVFAKRILVTGSTVFTGAELAAVTEPYEHREISTEDLEELRRALTLLYVNKGYPNSGAIMPDQSAADGQITVHIIEGTLSEVRIEGTTWFREGYLRDRIELGARPPFNVAPLRDRLQLLLQDPRLERVNAELKPGSRLGEAVLDVSVKETQPIKLWLEFNNYQTPVVGAERGLVTVAHQNLTGNADTASFTWGRSRGVDPIIDTSYALPLNRYDTTLVFAYRRNDFVVVEQTFRPLDITSQSEIFTVALRHPLYRTLTDEIALTVTGERLFNKTTLLGEGFDFVPGTRNGTAVVSAIRFGQEWIHRTADSVMAMRSRMSWGVDVLGATINSGSMADGRYFSWLGQANWVKRFASSRVEMVNRIDLQVADDRLYPLEQLAVGGRFSVRGYRENTLIRDNAFLYSFEPRFSLWRSNEGYDILQVAPFVDVGRGWSVKGEAPEAKWLASIGVGLRLNILNRGFASVYWGQQLNHVAVLGAAGNIQDHGIHVQVSVNAL